MRLIPALPCACSSVRHAHPLKSPLCMRLTAAERLISQGIPGCQPRPGALSVAVKVRVCFQSKWAFSLDDTHSPFLCQPRAVPNVHRFCIAFQTAQEEQGAGTSPRCRVPVLSVHQDNLLWPGSFGYENTSLKARQIFSGIPLPQGQWVGRPVNLLEPASGQAKTPSELEGTLETSEQ